jgi:hypothetical protein
VDEPPVSGQSAAQSSIDTGCKIQGDMNKIVSKPEDLSQKAVRMTRERIVRYPWRLPVETHRSRSRGKQIRKLL